MKRGVRGWRSQGGRAILYGLSALWMLSGEPGIAQIEGCTECHDDIQVTSPVHGGFDCGDCHTEVTDLPHPEAAGQQLLHGEICAQCHDIDVDLAEGVHRDLACEDCHGSAHEVVPPSELESPVSPLHQFQTCGRCHGEPPELIEGYLASVHARALLVSGLASAPSCIDCHGKHDIYAISDPRSPVSRRKMPETCGSCHLFILRTWEEQSAHGIAWTEDDPAGPTCITCHASHKVLRPTRPDPRLKFPEGCGGCHGEEYATYRDSFHGKATDLGFMTAAICSDCHTPHRNLPAADPRSSVHPENLQQTCGTCHGEVSASFVTFNPHSDPTGAGSHPVVHFVWVFMTGLLIAVFSFFTIHHGLWVQRSVVGALRGELSRVRHEGPYVRRFTRSQVRTHLVMVSTFLLLAATGLPLKFHAAPWAKTLAGAFGGVGTTSLLHRIAAVLTFAYFLFHVGDLTRRALLGKEPGLFWGWKSMIPRGKDLADLWQNLRYFLYLAPRPRLDRWTYWEKFDYFAVFWGVAIIGCSGLMIWQPDAVTRLFPGWVLNAAFVIHSDEALLAVGFIFVFHFFHTHLRPEAFPLDPVIFTGSMPLSRFEEERPLEYRRMVERGELEKLLVDPPSPQQQRFAYGFGLAALTIGTLLAVGILWALLAHWF